MTVYWVSYLENQQRVLLFTQDERVASNVRSRIDAEKSNTELFVSLCGVGVSLVSRSKNFNLVKYFYLLIDVLRPNELNKMFLGYPAMPIAMSLISNVLRDLISRLLCVIEQKRKRTKLVGFLQDSP